jgi:hypothetical protein
MQGKEEASPRSAVHEPGFVPSGHVSWGGKKQSCRLNVGTEGTPVGGGSHGAQPTCGFSQVYHPEQTLGRARATNLTVDVDCSLFIYFLLFVLDLCKTSR